MKSFEVSSGVAPQGPAYVIRPGRPEDAGQIAAVLAECFHPTEGLAGLFQPWIQAGLKGEIGTRLRTPPTFYRCFVAAVDDSPVATAEVALRSLPQPWWMPSIVQQERLAYISNLAVGLAWRRRGVARALLAAMEEQVVRWNHRSIHLHVMENNEGALHLYRSLGYRLLRAEQELTFLGPRKFLLNKKLTQTSILES